MSIFRELQRNESQQRWRLYAISVGITFVLAPQYCLASLQTSIGVKNALGPYSVLVYSLLCLFSLLAYVPLSAWIGRKNCLIVGEIFSVIYTIVLLHQNVWIMTGGAILLGIGESVLLTAAGAIISSFNDDGLNGGSKKNSLAIYLTTLGFGQVLVNLIPKLILKDSNGERNTTFLKTKGVYDVSDCGSSDCPLEYAFKSTANVFGQLVPTYHSLLIFLSIFGSLQIAGIVLHYVVVRNDRTSSNQATSNDESHQLLLNEPSGKAQADLKTAFTKLFTHLKLIRRLMFIPIQIQNAAFNAFLWSEITRSYFSCPFGVENIGVYLLATYISSFVASAVYSKFASSLSPPVLYVFAYIAETTSYGVAYFWQPSPNSMWVPILLAIFAGFTHGFRRIVSYVTASVYFDDLDSSYVVQTGASAIGTAAVYAVASLLCVYVKIYALVSLSFMSTIVALIAHYRYS